MAGGDCEVGKCPVCKKENVRLNRKYYYYNINCECHSPQHFEIAYHCDDCEPIEPIETKISMSTAKLASGDIFKVPVNSY